MSDIDWSKAPEGATHRYGGLWYKKEDGTLYVWEKIWYLSTMQNVQHSERFIPRPPQQYTGTGLPPVGSVVEVVDVMPHERYKGHVGKHVKILEHRKRNGYDVAVYEVEYSGGFEYHALVAERFRPLRTERDRAIERMASIMENGRAGAQAKSELVLMAAQDLYDAGCRMP